MAFPTLNMGLIAWDLGDDPYDYHQLSNNFAAIDGHTHEAGKGKQVPSGGLANASVINSKLAPNSVASSNIIDGAVGPSDLANDSVRAQHILDGSVGASEIANASVEFRHLSKDVSEIGDIKMWYRPNASIPLPTGWVPIDGRPWSSVPNAWGLTSGNMPNFLDRVPVGASTSGATMDIGQLAGSMTANLTHTHTSNPHTHVVSDHSHTIPSHTHTIPDHAHGIGFDGLHGHTVSGGSSFFTNQHGRFDGNFTFKDTSNNNHNTSFSHTYIAGRDVAAIAPIDTAGGHSHGGTTLGWSGTTGSASGTTGAAGALSTTSQSDTGMTDALGSTSVRNASVGVLFLMRVQ